ncbi:MAG: tetratricopeptide repeat protein [Pseudonocardiaceae bacterium]
MTGEGRKRLVVEFCAGLRRLQKGSGLNRTALARRVSYSRSQLYEILDGQIRRPPDWDRLVEPLVRACTGNDERAVGIWRHHHSVLLEVYHELKRQDRQDGPSRPVGVVSAVPAQLLADVDDFTGRAEELAELDRLLITPDLGAAGGEPTAVVISAVSGTAGVGKTALALRWAHRVRNEFPHGQLYVNLRGYDPDQPLSAADTLAGFLRALGVAGQDISQDVDERAAAYRSLLDGRRVLVVLDNASSVEQVRPLLPGSSSAVVLVTSRDSLVGLVARHGARRLNLGLLPPDDAVTLLWALIGERVEAEPEATTALARQCARLPLALRVAAELAAARPAISLAELVDELADQQRRLDLLDAGGDPRTAVRATFSWSYQHLPADIAETFRLIGLHPGSDLDLYAAAALLDTGLERAQHLLGVLVRAHLIGYTGVGRYGMHDLLRSYVTELAVAEDSEDERRVALTRLFDHYLATAAAAMTTLVPAEQHRRPPILPSATPIPPVTDPAAARAWLDAERATLLAACVHTAAHGWPGHTTRLASTLFRYLEIGGHYLDAVAIHTHARHAAHHTHDPVAEAHMLTNLGITCWRQDRYEQAVEHFQQALGLFRKIGDRTGEARAVGNLGLVYGRQGRYEQAVKHHQDALAWFREIGYRAGEAGTLTNLGAVYWWQGRYEKAAEHLRQALDLSREIGDRASETDALTNLGLVDPEQGGYGQAVDHLQQALDLSREIGHRAGEARALDTLGGVYRRQGCYEDAAEHLRQALALLRKIGDRSGEAGALNGLGETHRATGELREARTQHTAALTVATQIGDRYEQARTHNGLAHTHHTTGDPEQTRQHWREALALYADLGVPDADDVRAHLNALDQAADGVED